MKHVSEPLKRFIAALPAPRPPRPVTEEGRLEWKREEERLRARDECLALGNRGIPIAFWHARIEDLPFPVPSKPENLYLYGAPGRGKSHAAAALAIAWRARWVTTFRLLIRLKSSFQGRGEHEAEILKELSSPSVLVLDDLWAAQKTDFVLQWILGLLNARMEELHPTIITCDRSPAEIRKLDTS
ncbi:MAG TPA: ATP-binding protein, partial [Candidatus Polarisedimenticolia bacterium]|nr:ATP-binding protein [Candidatus Polarisedimenticolia bacterium]